MRNRDRLARRKKLWQLVRVNRGQGLRRGDHITGTNRNFPRDPGIAATRLLAFYSALHHCGDKQKRRRAIRRRVFVFPLSLEHRATRVVRNLWMIRAQFKPLTRSAFGRGACVVLGYSLARFFSNYRTTVVMLSRVDIGKHKKFPNSMRK